MKLSKKLMSCVLTLALVLSLATGGALAFSDMRESSHWAYTALDAAVNSGLLSGYEDGSLRPGDTVTRAEAAAIINRAFDAKTQVEISFADVSPDDWYYQDVAKSVAMGSFTGVSATEFDPKSDVTREQVFTVLARTLKMETGGTSALAAFSDGGDVSDWAADYVAAMAAAGYISGSGKALSPKDSITREQLAQVLYNVLDLGQKGHWQMKNYTSNGETVKYLAMEGVSYCQKPVDPEYQTMNIFVPADFIKADGAVDNEIVVNGYLAETAPIIFANNVGGYAKSKAGSFNSTYVDYIKNGYIVVVPGCRGKNSGDEAGGFTGKAPAAIVDLKAAVRYLKANDDTLPGNSNMIVSVGGSAGGALSSLLGATGNSRDYFPYLEAIGADMSATDDVYAAMCYCPITDLDNADSGYEWMFGESGLTGFEAQLSQALADDYVSYVNSLELKDENGEALTLNSAYSGEYYNKLLSALEDGLASYLENTYQKSSGGMSNYTYLDEEACQSYVDRLNAEGNWISLSFTKATASTGPSQLVEYSSGAEIEMTSLADFNAKYLSRMKSVPSFDVLGKTSAENQLFGTEVTNYSHFSDAVLSALKTVGGEEALIAEYENDISRFASDNARKLMNPMNYIGTDESCDAAPYFRVRVGAKDNHTSQTVALNLALALEKEDVSVNYGLVWDKGHGAVDYDGQFISWIERICKTQAKYTDGQIAAILNVKNSADFGWAALDTDSDGITDGYRLNKTVCVACPEIAANQGISVTVPAEYLNDDFTINHTGTVNGYTADSAPIVLNTGAAGYSQSTTGTAGTGYLKDGYINVACGNRGKQSTAVSAQGEKYFCGDSPYCLVDQKAAVRWLKYNIGLGNIPGCADRIVSKGGSGGGAHAIMMAAMGNHPDYYPYLEKTGAIMSYTDASGKIIQISDGVFGCDPLSPITCLEEANISYEWQWGLAAGDKVNQSKLGEFRHILSDAMAKQYVRYVNALGLKDENGEPLTINDDGLTGTYVDYFQARLIEALEWYLNNLDADTLNWLPENGESYAEAYINGHYYKTSRVMGGGYADGTGNTDTGATTTANGADLSSWVTLKKDESGLWDADFAIGDYFNYATRSKTNPSFDDLDLGQAENQEFGDYDSDCRHFDEYVLAAMTESYDALAAAYDGEAKAEVFDEIYGAYEHDVAEIRAGDQFGGNIVYLYNPTRYIVDQKTWLPSHVRIVTGTKDTDASLTVSLNCYIEFKMMGVDTVLGWSWDQGHCGSAPLNTTFQGWLDGLIK